jgi:RNA polymerase sigma factor (sigma-70 family)
VTALKEFRVKLSVRNNLLVSRREAVGLSAPELAEKLGVCYSAIWKLETLRESPLLEDGTSWSKAARKLAEFYRVLPEDLFPDAILAANHTSVEREMGAQEAFALAGGLPLAPDDRLIAGERIRSVTAALAELSPRQQRLLAARFGLDGSEGITYEEMGERLGVSRERARQLEVAALRKLAKSDALKAAAP